MLTTVAVYGLVALLAWVAFSTLWLWRNQERVVFQPPPDAPVAPAPARRVEYDAADGHRLFGYLQSPDRAANNGVVVIVFHGNADLAAWQAPWGRELARRSGATVLLAEYRGYGGIPGRPTYESSKADALGALAFAQTLKPKRIVLFGHSLGTAIATELAVAMPSRPDALVLQSPLSSARDMAARMMVPTTSWLWRAISRFHFDTESAVRSLDVPVYVAHGAIDITIPTRMGRAVFAAAKRPGELLIVAGAGHAGVPDVGGEPYWRWLVSAVTGTSAPVLEVEQQRGGRLPRLE